MPKNNVRPESGLTVKNPFLTMKDMKGMKAYDIIIIYSHMRFMLFMAN